MKTLALIHGFHLDSPGWQEVIWGDPKGGRWGRAAKGILEALKFDASIVVFGSGASQREDIPEAQCIYDYALAHLDDLSDSAGMSSEDLKTWLEKRVIIDAESQNTQDEVRNAMKVARENGIERIIVVSSPWHIMRCLQLALSECANDPSLRYLLRNLYATASKTNAPDARADDVVIIEPTHRPDRPPVPFAHTIKGMMPFLKTDKAGVARDFNDALTRLIEEWKERF